MKMTLSRLIRATLPESHYGMVADNPLGMRAELLSQLKFEAFLMQGLEKDR
jgi:hypothetical protein